MWKIMNYSSGALILFMTGFASWITVLTNLLDTGMQFFGQPN